MKRYPLFIIIIISTILVVTIFIWPLIASIFIDDDIGALQLLQDESSGMKASLYRTVVFALLSTVLCVTGSLLLAIRLSNISFYSRMGRVLSLFMLPIALGNVTMAYIFKIVWFDSAFLDYIIKNGVFAQYALLIFLQCWQYLFLFAYLFWMQIQSIPREITAYSSVIDHTRMEYLKDIILPAVKKLFILLLLLGFIFSFYENAKSNFILKVSQGTKTELISQAIDRIYHSNLGLDPSFAYSTVYHISFLVFIIISTTLFILGLVAPNIISILSGFRYFFHGELKLAAKASKIHSSYFISMICILIIFLPIIAALMKSHYHFSLEVLCEPVSVFFLTVAAALFSTIIAILFSIASKVILKKFLNVLNTKSLGYLLAIFLLQVIPPLCIVLCLFKYFAIVGYDIDLFVYVVWIIGHGFLNLPVLGSFVLVAHYAVKVNELDYLSVHQVCSWGIIKYSFIKRFQMEYILTFLFAFIFIWNDAGLNMVLSDNIPSFAKKLEMLFMGKAANYSQATLYVLIALILATIFLSVWQCVINKIMKSRE